MIRSFRHKGLSEFYNKGKSGKVQAELCSRINRRLDVLDAARGLAELNLPGFDFHSLRGHKPTRYSLHLNGPWCITFEWSEGDAFRVDLEQYH
jgi:proteic killer suppression protein